MTAPETNPRPTWPDEPLYRFLFNALPDWHTITGILDVPRLATRLALSEEAIYKWFRRGKLPPRRVRDLHKLTYERVNLEKIAGANSAAPDLAQFYDFAD